MECIIFVEASQTGAGEVACAYAKNSGYFVILFCKSILNYKQTIFKNCDSVIEIDTTKISELINETIKLQQKFCIKAVTTTSDFFVVQTAQLCEYLNLPGNSVSSVENIKNKLKMRNEIQKFKPELNPQYFHALSFEDAIKFATNNGFPFIAKPINGNDSLHVKKISNTYDLQKYFNDRKQWGVDVSGQNFENGVLLESFVQGTEFCLDLLKSVSGKLILIGAFKKMLAGTEQGYFIKIGASFPASSMDTDLLFKEISPLVEHMEFAVGAINIDCKIENGKVKILEMNPRLVGDQMGSHMIEIATGLNPAHAIVDVSCGKDLIWQPKKIRGVAIHRLTMPFAGYFAGLYNLENLKEMEHVECVNILGEIGKWIEPASSNQGVIGSVIVSHETAELAMILACEIASHIEVKVDILPTAHGWSGLKNQIQDNNY